MKIIKLSKQLNNTELGKGGTHDTYVLIPTELDITDIFTEPNTFFSFVDRNDKSIVKIRNTIGREKRLVGLGEYYRSQGLLAGDEIVLECEEIDGICNYYVSTNKHSDSLVVKKNDNSYEILNEERIDLFLKLAKKANLLMKIEFFESKKKRSDSPQETNYYRILYDDKDIISSNNSRDNYELTVKNNKLVISKFYGWKKEKINTEV